MLETIGDGAGWVKIRKHTRFVRGVFSDLRSCWMGQRDTACSMLQYKLKHYETIIDGASVWKQLRFPPSSRL